jgi:hypothetical protein
MQAHAAVDAAAHRPGIAEVEHAPEDARGHLHLEARGFEEHVGELNTSLNSFSSTGLPIRLERSCIIATSKRLPLGCSTTTACSFMPPVPPKRLTHAVMNNAEFLETPSRSAPETEGLLHRFSNSLRDRDAHPLRRHVRQLQSTVQVDGLSLRLTRSQVLYSG